jgi:hypothetical protein
MVLLLLSMHRQLLYWQRQRAATGVAAVHVVSLPFPRGGTRICCDTEMLQVRADTSAIIGALAVMAM